MTIEWATLVAGTETPAGDGITGALRCVISTVDGQQLSAVLKRDVPELVFAEAITALLLRAWGLPVPPPYLIREQNGIAFASADVGYPNLKKALGISEALGHLPEQQVLQRMAMAVVLQLPSTALAIVADEAIDNRDRNFGNILWDGTSEAWIDHAHALGNAPHMADRNLLCMMATALDQGEPALQAALARWTAIDRSQVAVSAAAIQADYDCAAWQTMISSRLENLGMRLVARFPNPSDLLAQVPPQ